jgi:large subunit ribosomal protein L21
MFAVIKTGGKQYKVQKGDQIDVELIDCEENKPAVFDEVLLIGDGDKVTIGRPLVEGASVKADILGEVKDKKVVAFNFRRRKGSHRTVGHRQKKLRVKISDIKG